MYKYKKLNFIDIYFIFDIFIGSCMQLTLFKKFDIRTKKSLESVIRY